MAVLQRRRERRTSALLTAVLTLGIVTVGPGAIAPVEAQVGNADIVVDSAGDGPDADPTDERCRTAAGDCTLRAAIEQANSDPGPNQIRFAIPGSGIKTIAPQTQLPSVNDASGATVIDGFSQPGATVNTATTGSNARVLIQVVGSGQASGIRVDSAGNTVRGLAVSGFVTNIHLVGEAADGNRIVGNFVGALADGTQGPTPTAARYTWGVQLELGPDQNAIGTPALADRNVISGNGTWGLAINHGETSENLVQNNVIGLTPDLTGNLAQRIGVDIQWWTWGNLIGGDRAREGNLISGNQLTTGDGFHAAIDLSHDAVFNQVIGNFVGTLGDGNRVAPYSANTQGLAIKDNANDNYIADNVIGNSLYDGIKHRHNYSGHNVFVGNRVGVGIAGGAAGNRYGVILNGHDQLMLDNLIAYNRSSPVLVLDSRLGLSSTTRYLPEKTVRNPIRQNTFHNNGSAGTWAVRAQVDAWTFEQSAAVDAGDGISRFVSGSWSEVSGALKHVSVGVDGSLWGVNSNNDVYRRAADASRWTHMPDDLDLVQIDARAYDEAAAVDSSDQIYRFVGGRWSQVSGALKHVSIGTDGSLWGVNSNNSVYRRAVNASRWTHMPDNLDLVQIDARTYDEAAAVDSSDRIYRFAGGRWTLVSGALKHVSIGTDGSLWGVNSNNHVYRRAANASGWEQLQGELSADAPLIDLFPADRTPNDPGDGDDGPHLLLNTPELTGLGWVNNRGEIYGTACAGCSVEVSVSGAIRADGTIDGASTSPGTGATWAGTVTARADGTFSLRDTRFRPGKQILLIAIDPSGNTSESTAVTMPSQPTGIIGNPMASEARMPRPAAPARPQPWVPPTFGCELNGDTLTWDDAGASEYYVFAVTNGSERYLGAHSTTSLSVSTADSYRVEHWVNGFATNAICEGGGGAGSFSCSAVDGVLSWDDTGASAYYVFAVVNGSERYLGGHATNSLDVPPAASYRVEHWATGQATNALCDGPGDAGSFSCSVSAGVLSWGDDGALEYYVFANVNGFERYLGGHATNALPVPAADSYRVEHWLTGQATNALCS